MSALSSSLATELPEANRPAPISTASLDAYVADPRFPCVMAKAVFSKGYVNQHSFDGADPEVVAPQLLSEMTAFVGRFRKEKRLSSFIISFEDASLFKFEEFERFFWKLLGNLDALDKQAHAPDARVSNDPNSPHFSFSVGGEAFFMLILHPESPRLARRFRKPTVVFNAHQQFEDLRKKGLFQKVRDLIRKRDASLQGYINPMVSDYGSSSEVYQYTGREYPRASKCPFQRASGAFKNLVLPQRNAV